MKIGIYGGSFDPSTPATCSSRQAAVEELGLDRMFFIPVSQSPFKPAEARARRRPPATPAPRARRQIDCEIDDQEIRRGGISYTIDTLRDYAKRFPGAELFYLIGADNAARLNEWREAGELARLAQFVVVPRPGGALPNFPPPFRGRALKGFPFGVSSSQIRARVQKGRPSSTWSRPPSPGRSGRRGFMFRLVWPAI